MAELDVSIIQKQMDAVLGLQKRLNQTVLDAEELRKNNEVQDYEDMLLLVRTLVNLTINALNSLMTMVEAALKGLAEKKLSDKLN